LIAKETVEMQAWISLMKWPWYPLCCNPH